ncbi:hypothetical protein F8M41_015173 [Gigaspora margarita]|uniref:Uncharacterized protein n=1 Tax=Gigaspora margarita TaxID=4874 RepID=A0A8H4AQT4_GIGMA|nr:hypothetical protein F8M41_015173 [Gigaspora margarita]
MMFAIDVNQKDPPLVDPAPKVLLAKPLHNKYPTPEVVDSKVAPERPVNRVEFGLEEERIGEIRVKKNKKVEFEVEKDEIKEFEAEMDKPKDEKDREIRKEDNEACEVVKKSPR